MKADISKLLEMQKLDAERSEKELQIAQHPKRLKEIEEVFLDAANAVNDAKARLEAMEKKRQDMRAQRRALEEKAFNYKIQLATIKKQSDYEAISADIEKSKQKASEIEEEEIQVLFEIDESREKISQMEASLPSVRADADLKISKLNETFSEEKKLHETLSSKISELKNEIPESFLSVYERLRKSGKKLPILVALTPKGCSGCFIRVSSLPSEIANSATPVCCEHCGRILYCKD